MYKEKMIIDDLKWYAIYYIKEIEKEENEKGKISDYDDGYKEAMTFILEKIEKYEKETDNDKR